MGNCPVLPFQSPEACQRSLEQTARRQGPRPDKRVNAAPKTTTALACHRLPVRRRDSASRHCSRRVRRHRGRDSLPARQTRQPKIRQSCQRQSCQRQNYPRQNYQSQSRSTGWARRLHWWSAQTNHTPRRRVTARQKASERTHTFFACPDQQTGSLIHSADLPRNTEHVMNSGRGVHVGAFSRSHLSHPSLFSKPDPRR
jgi:hypothetical protein